MYEIKNLSYQPMRLIIGKNSVIITARNDNTNNPIYLEALNEDIIRLNKLGMLKIKKAIKK
jgi:hypothetical protein